MRKTSSFPIAVLLLLVTGIVTLVGTIVLGRDFMLRRT